jgi:hypothetical protein
MRTITTFLLLGFLSFCLWAAEHAGDAGSAIEKAWQGIIRKIK